MPEYCEIKIRGQLSEYWSEWFAGLKLTKLEEDVCLLSGWLPDQAALHGLLERIWDLNLTLISVTSNSSSGQKPEPDAASERSEDQGARPEEPAGPTTTDRTDDRARRIQNG